MKNKILRYILIISIPFILTGCGKEESLFDNMDFNQSPIDLANPVNIEETIPEVNVIEPERNLYYDRYLPEENSYIPSQMTNTLYNTDDNSNKIPNSLISSNFSRENLRQISCLVNNYNLAENDEFSWKYFYKDKNVEGSRDYFTLEKSLSLIGKLKDDSLDFNDLRISRNYNFNNCNNVESFSLYLSNLEDTKQGIDFSKEILSNLITEDMVSIFLNSPNDLDSDTIQSFSKEVNTEDKNSTYSFFREFKTPLKESSDKVSTKFDIKFRDSLSQKQLRNKTVINNQGEKFQDNYNLDLGNFKEVGAFNNFYNNNGCFSNVLKISAEGALKYTGTRKEYENLKYTVYNEKTNLNPEDKFNSYEEYHYDTKVTTYNTYKNDKVYETSNIGNLTLNYNYKKLNNEFSSLSLYIEDSFFIPKDTQFSEKYNVNDTIRARISSWLSKWNLDEYYFGLDEETSLFLTIDNLYCKVTIKPTQYIEGNNKVFNISLNIESDDIFEEANTQIILENEIEYDIEGNVINKDSFDIENNNFNDNYDEIESLTDISKEDNIENLEEETQIENNTENDKSDITGGSLSDLF